MRSKPSCSNLVSQFMPLYEAQLPLLLSLSLSYLLFPSPTPPLYLLSPSPSARIVGLSRIIGQLGTKDQQNLVRVPGYLWQSRNAGSERVLLILPLSSSCAHTGGERSLSVFFYQLELTRANSNEGAPCLQFPPLEPQEPRPDSPGARTHQNSGRLGAGAYHAPSRLESSHWSNERWAAHRSSALSGRTRLWGEGRKAPGIPAQCDKQQNTYPREFLPQYLRIVWPSSESSRTCARSCSP
ncbi:hypothetical protein ElyMa_006427900 [Elysia marginata]|uniref:Uncharacterized protein n=1 Tax=Elysia marginata TaxID=1093978 RepID=A0AAV4HYW8_9GAST|nr:hypothetical protein ElyMa_006427900 [Elysia marginata]